MRPEPARWVLGSLLGLTIVGVGGLRAADPPSDRMLAKHGLVRSGPLLVLEAESEVHARAEEVRGTYQQLLHAVARQRATMSEKEYQATIKGLNDELNQLKAQSNLATQNINRIPRRRGYPVYWEQFQELTYYRNRLRMEISQRTAYLNEIKGRPFDARDRVKADSEVRDRREALHQGALELRKLVDEVHQKYAAVEKDPQVKRWLETPEGPAGVKPKLGPSRAFKLDQKLLERVEGESASDGPGEPPNRSSRKGRHSTRAKHSRASGDAGSPF